MEDFYALRIKGIWKHFKSEHFSFWMICGYLFFEYVRPQSIWRWLDFLPWAQLFVLGSLIGWVFDRKKKWVSASANKWMILFLVCILLSSWNAYYPEMSMRYLANYYTWMIIYFLIINIVNTKKRFFIFIFIFLIASFKLSLSLSIKWASRGFGFTSWGLSGPPGFFQNSGELAIQMLVFWPIALAIALNLKPFVSRLKYLLLISMPITAGLVILGTSSRGGQLALVAQLATKYYKKVFRFKVIVTVLLIAATAWYLLPQEQKDRFAETGEDRTSQQRLLYWENGLDMMLEHPVLGVGHYNFIPYYERFYPEDMLYEYAELAHNIFIQVGADLGMTGLLIYVLLIVSAFRISSDIRKATQGQSSERIFGDIASAMNISFVGFLVAGQFVSVVYYPFMWIHMALVVSLYSIIRSTNVVCER